MYEFTSTAETPEERIIRQRQTLIKRMRILGGVLVISVVARVFIKPPPPPKSPDLSKLNIRVVPGVLDKIPAATLAKMDPKVVAQIRVAEMRKVQDNLTSATANLPAYTPVNVPLDNLAEEEAYKQLTYTYAKKRVEVPRPENMAPSDLRKKTLILFRGGGFIKAEKALLLFKSCQIRVDNTFQATVPSKYVASVSENALSWKEPIPKGHVRLKPAKGITITVARETARRIRGASSSNEI